MRKTVLLPIVAVLCVSCALFLCDDVSCGETDPFRCGESATYIFDPDTGLMTIEGIGPMYDYLDDQPWKSYRESIKAIKIGNEITGVGAYAFYGCTSVESISLPDSVAAVGDYSFAHCSLASELDLGNGIRTVGTCAFYGCISIPSVHIPSSLTRIGQDAFFECTGLSFVSVAEGNPAYSSDVGVLFDKDMSVLILFPSKSDMRAYPVPYPVETIAGGAFHKCSNLEYVSVYRVKSIGDAAFQSCTSLTRVDIRSLAVSLGDRVFEGCTALSEVALSEGLAEIGEGTFSKCESLVSVKFPNSLRTIGAYAFSECTSLESVDIPYFVTSIGDSAFFKCSSLSEVVIGCGVKTVDTAAFYECTSLERVTFGVGVESIGSIPFSVTFRESDGTPVSDMSAENLRGSVFLKTGDDLVRQQVFDIVFKVSDEEEYVEVHIAGDLLEDPGIVPYKEPDHMNTYLFMGWEGFEEGSAVTGDAVYTAIFQRHTIISDAKGPNASVAVAAIIVLAAVAVAVAYAGRARS